ncbi:MAG: metal ABC transporter ATP-binding protein [Anaerolineaceae bacterium]|nr:MAG: metal ABC transporter ATP-binding protein [Anaerolineaceae bacterium]
MDIFNPALVVEHLSAGYPGHRRAIDDISFSVWRGERVAVIGPNGAGKSTLFKALAGIIPHQTGAISLHGEDCRTSHMLIGYVPQSDGVDLTFPVTVYDVVMMGRAREIGWFRWPRRADHLIVAEALERVGVWDLRNRQIGQLSGGQRQRVFIARALAQQTDVLLLDEPFSGVDVNAEHEIMNTLNSLQQGGITMLIATHDLHMASTQFDKLLAINQRMVGYGDSGEVFTPNVLQATYGGRVGIVGNGDEQMVVIADAQAG